MYNRMTFTNLLRIIQTYLIDEAGVACVTREIEWRGVELACLGVSRRGGVVCGEVREHRLKQ